MSPRPSIDHIRKPQILEAAASVITERGLAGTRISDVAGRAGTSPAAVLYWFGSREEMLTEALIADERRFANELDQRLAAAGSASDRLMAIFVATAEEPDWSLWIELWARSLHDAPARRARQRLDDLWQSTLEDVIGAGQAAGEFAADLDAARIAAILAALMDGLGVQVTLADPSVGPQRMLAIAVEVAEAQLGVRLGTAAAAEVPA